jgi:hypothetical protein
MKSSKTIVSFLFMIAMLINLSCTMENNEVDDLFSYAKTRTNDLQFSIYIGAGSVDKLLSTEAGRREAISIFRCNGITKAIVETYRAGLIVDKSLLVEVRDYFLKNGIEVVGGIATVPGGDFGVRQDAKLGWFNWQNPKTQTDLKKVVKMSAEIFDEFIIDDFLCTGDTSLESKSAKGNESWSKYRRDLLTKLSSEIFINPAKEVNPDIKMIIKYPQWYDRFHLFGYELAREPQLFDKVWVGTESRGQYTQRYGFVQPYEGFVNYSWIKDIAGKKIGGAWFDHGDCDENDFIEQAYQAVLAGAQEITLFSYNAFIDGHKGHHFIRTHFNKLADLAKSVANNPVVGIAGYKPINSDAGGDLYLMDFIGTLGIPLVPVHQYPANAKVIFLPTQAAADKEILTKVEKSISNGATLIFTTGFLANAANGDKLAELAGVRYPIKISSIKAEKIIVDDKSVAIKHGLDLESNITISNGEALLNALAKSKKIALLTKSNRKDVSLFTLNTHTFSQADFDKVGEVLLCPKELGLLEIPKKWSNTIRSVFTSKIGFELDAPTRVVIQPLGTSGWMLHNYNKTSETIALTSDIISSVKLVNGFNGEIVNKENNKVKMTIEPRSRLWLKIEK